MISLHKRCEMRLEAWFGVGAATRLGVGHDEGSDVARARGRARDGLRHHNIGLLGLHFISHHS